MSRHETSRPERLLCKQHECRMQESRHERKMEMERLNRLNSSLQTKLEADRLKNQIRAAA